MTGLLRKRKKCKNSKEGRKKILIIDDDENFTQSLKVYLEKTGRYEVLTESHGKQGVAVTRTFRPDIIFLDIVMPDLEGSEVAYKIKYDKELRNIPIVFLTGAVTKKELASQDGVIGSYPFIAKPVSLRELIECIENITKKTT